MLIIRNEQMQTLADARLGERIYHHLLQAHPGAMAPLDAPTSKRRIAQAIKRARRYGLTWEVTIADFVALCFTVGPCFYAQERVQAVLQDIAAAPQPDQQFMRLDAMVGDQDWDEARSLYPNPAGECSGA